MAQKELGIVSAYGEWLVAGNQGTKKQFLESLKGKNGKSAYEVAVASGFSGSQVEWLASLKGAKGDSGITAGIPSGGQKGDFLCKNSASNLDTGWVPKVSKGSLAQGVQDSLDKADVSISKNLIGEGNGVAGLDAWGHLYEDYFPGSNSVLEAEKDGSAYVRKDAKWTQLNTELEIPVGNILDEKMVNYLKTSDFGSAMSSHNDASTSHPALKTLIDSKLSVVNGAVSGHIAQFGTGGAVVDSGKDFGEFLGVENLNVHMVDSNAHSNLFSRLNNMVENLEERVDAVSPEVGLSRGDLEEHNTDSEAHKDLFDPMSALLNKVAKIDVSGYASEQYVDDAISSVDLSGYASEQYVDMAVAGVAGFDPTGIATETYVQNALANLSIPNPANFATVAQGTLAENAIPQSAKGVANGVASLGGDGRVLQSQLPTMSGGGSDGSVDGLFESFTYAVGSDQALADWANNVAGNDYSRVLIRAGTWTYSCSNSVALDISDGRTLSVVGEAGSKLNIIFTVRNQSVYGIKGIVVGTFPNLVDPGKDYFFNNVNIECTVTSATSGSYAYGFYTCSNLTNCTGTATSGFFAYGFFDCFNLTNCTGTGTATSGSYAYGFYTCSNLTNCTGTGTATSGSNAYGFFDCFNLTNCTGTATSGSSASGFNTCSNLTNCTGTGTATSGSSAYGFNTCRTGFACKKSGFSSTATFNDCYMEQDSGITLWANTAAGGWNNPA